MAKVYMFRHQQAGIVTTHVFLERPTDEQLGPLKAEAERLHGREGWGIVHEAELVGPGEMPFVPPPPGAAGAGAAASPPPFGVTGTGTVSNR